MADGKELGIVGLGRMGGGLALHALELGYSVFGFSTGGAREELTRAGLVALGAASEFARMRRPRRVLLYIPAGRAVDAVLDELSRVLEAGDAIADGGNSYWGDSIRRHARLKARGLDLMDVGTSGGVAGARQGACFMVGGEKDAVAKFEPLLRPLAVEGGYVHAGPPGAGHFVKLVHNGIEFGMLQAIGEGFDVLTRYRDPIDIAGTLDCWRHGSVIRSWLIDLIAEAYKADPTLHQASAFVEDTGEVNWLIEDALKMEAPIPVISQAVMQLFASRDVRKNWARAIVQMRHGFGGHPFGPDADVARERREGRVGD
jgi:6-phosphogluconate dehydrogenase